MTKASLSGQHKNDLTKNEAEVLSLITKDFYTIKQIAHRRKTTRRAVQLIVQRLKKKGYYSGEASPGGGVAKVAKLGLIRLHALQWKVGFLRVSSWDRVRSCVVPELMGCHVVVHDSFLEIYGKKDLFFEGVDEWACMALALGFFERVARRLENDFRVVLIKERCSNWELVKAEWATVGSEVASRHIGDGVKLEVFGTGDGRLWFWGDWSKKVPEHETFRKVDSVEVNRHLNDWRDFHPPTNSELLGILSRVVSLQEETNRLQHEQAAGLSVLIKVVSPPPIVEPVVVVKPFYVG